MKEPSKELIKEWENLMNGIWEYCHSFIKNDSFHREDDVTIIIGIYKIQIYFMNAEYLSLRIKDRHNDEDLLEYKHVNNEDQFFTVLEAFMRTSRYNYKKIKNTF